MRQVLNEVLVLSQVTIPKLLTPEENPLEYCRSILEKFRPDHKRIKIFIGFEVQPEIWHDCPIFDNPECALKQAKCEDRWERLKKKRGKQA